MSLLACVTQNQQVLFIEDHAQNHTLPRQGAKTPIKDRKIGC